MIQEESIFDQVQYEEGSALEEAEKTPEKPVENKSKYYFSPVHFIIALVAGLLALGLNYFFATGTCTEIYADPSWNHTSTFTSLQLLCKNEVTPSFWFLLPGIFLMISYLFRQTIRKKEPY